MNKNPEDLTLEIERLRSTLQSARLTIGELQAELAGDLTTRDSWLQRKVAHQRAALHRLEERVVNQRFTLRTLESLGRGLSADEVALARAAEAASASTDVVGTMVLQPVS